LIQLSKLTDPFLIWRHSKRIEEENEGDQMGRVKDDEEKRGEVGTTPLLSESDLGSWPGNNLMTF
jgi:hypothetical protein